MGKFKFAPLDGAYMATSILGLLISLMYVYEKSPDFGVAFAFVFGLMFFASMVSMTRADPETFIKLEDSSKKKRKKNTKNSKKN